MMWNLRHHSEIVSENVNISTDENIDKENNEIPEEANGDVNGFGIGDRIRLVKYDDNNNILSSQKLSADAWGNGKTFSASKLECDYYKIACIAVYKGDEIIDVINIDSKNSYMKTNDLYKEYGSDIDIAFNFNGYINGKDKVLYHYIGWLNIDKISNFTIEQKQKIAGESLKEDDNKVLINKK